MVIIKKGSGVFLGLFLAVAGCQKLDTTSPAVLSTTPPNGATSVAITADITIIFSESMDTASVEGALSTQPATTGSFSWENDSTVVYNPAANLLGDTTYTVKIAATARDLAGNGLLQDYEFSFSTGPVPTEEVELPAVMDAGIDEEYPGWNGDLSYIQVYDFTGVLGSRVGLVRFDVSQYQGADLKTAILKVYALGPDITAGALSVSRITDAWVESAVTWLTKPGQDTSVVVTTQIPGQAEVWIEADVTSFVESWLADSLPNHGLYLIVPNQGKTVGFEFASKEAADTTKQPKLHLEVFQPTASLQSTRLHGANRIVAKKPKI